MLVSPLLLSLIVQGIIGNRPEVVPAAIASGKLINATLVAEIPASQMRALANRFSSAPYVSFLNYGVQTHSITYQTEFKGRTITASGLIHVPIGLTVPAPLVSLQHGTIFEKKEAPSIAGGLPGLEYFSGAGFITMIPDYIGFGSSGEIFHPYYVGRYAASGTRDFILACLEFLQSQGIRFSKDLYLAGYSEGGYVTLATARELEHSSDFPLTLKGVAAGAGGYDLDHMLSSIATSSHYPYPAYLLYVILSYHTTYDWTAPLDTYIDAKYLPVASTALKGRNSGYSLNSQLTTDLRSFLTKEFYSDLKTPGRQRAFKDKLAENSIAAWKTKTPVLLVHGTNDEIIPYQNSVVVHDQFKKVGSTGVKLITVRGGNHGSTFYPMLKETLQWLMELRPAQTPDR